MNMTQATVYSKLSPGVATSSAPSHPVTSRSWRKGILNGCVITCFVFATNVILTILAAKRSQTSPTGQRNVFEGDCDRAKQLNTWLHFAINALSTLLLGASSYAMQCLSAPTRHEIDKAHAEKKWLDIGVLSLRNLATIENRRVWAWAVILLSSFPLHLL